MISDLPELTSFGNLLKFAAALEEFIVDSARHAIASTDVPALRDLLADCAARHEKRMANLERLRRERLNEMVLQPIYGLNRSDYLPDSEHSGAAGEDSSITALVNIEESSARFYSDAASVAAHVLTGVERSFKKMGMESRSIAARLSEKP